jgi:Peptidase family C25/Propeptide_C25/Peptidase family C25, C terminal ig-like domain
MLSGRDKQMIFLVISLLIASTVKGQAGKVYKYHFNGDLQKGNVIAGDQGIVINYSVNELNIESVVNSSGEFYKISIPGHNPTSDPGKPELPVLSRLISIPVNCTVSIKVSDVSTEIITPSTNNFKGILYPRQAGETKNIQKQRSDFLINKTEYSRHGFAKSDTVKVELTGKIRNRQLATLQIYPVRYDPYSNKIEVIRSMKIEVIFVPAKGSLSTASTNNPLLLNQSVDRSILNYNPSDVITGYSDQPVKMVIITDPAFKKNLEPFLRWKTQKGYKLNVLYKGTGRVGSTYAQLKDTLTKIYNSATSNNPAPEYLLLIGDVSRIPKSEGNGTNNISDMYYGEFDGNGDYIPDMYIGRLPVTDTNQLKAAIGKIIQYEKFQYADTNKFCTRAIASAGNDAGYVNYMNGQVKYEVSNYLNLTNKINGLPFYYPQSASNGTPDSIKKYINKGVSFINYTGHGDVLGWLGPLLRSADVSLLQNKNMYPFVISNACSTAEYDNPGSFGNTMIVTANKGAVGYIGCTNNSYWDEDYYWAVGIGTPNADPKYTETGLGALDRLFHTHGESPSDWYLSMGQVNYAGNLSVSGSTSTLKKYYWETYTLLGDPSTIPFIGTPDKFTISLPDTLPNGIKSFSLTLPPFSYAAVSHFDTLWDASYASPSGSVVLNLPGRSNDSCLIVITGQNRIPLIKTIHIADVTNEFINLTATSINDDSGNNNGQADYGESLSMDLKIGNLGLGKATDLYAKLTPTSNLVTITNDSVMIGTLTGKSEIIIPACFGIKVSDNVPDKGSVIMNLTLGDSKTVKNYTIDLSVHAPVLDILNCLIDDSGTGNGNNVAEPGETFRLLFKVTNSGSSDISGILNILNQPVGLTIITPSVNTGLLQAGKQVVIPVSVTLSSDFAHGGSVDIVSVLNCASYVKNKTFSVPIGKTRESFEYQKMNVFPWVNSATYPWTITSGQASDGQFSARSGAMPNSSTSKLKLTVNVPVKDTIRFDVKVSSELNYDFLSFWLNGTPMDSISGQKGWIEKKYALREGFNILEWVYRKDYAETGGEDCGWLDNIRFPSTAFINKDLKTGKIIAPQPGKSYNQEQITAQIINLGTDTVKSFNLAYQVNSNTPVFQNFVKKINPADSLVVAFSQSANLAGSGPYIIKVYGFNNNDSFLYNDTTLLSLVSTGIFTPVENSDNKVKIIPNPFRQSFRLEIESVINEDIKASVISLSGKILWEGKYSLVPGLNSFTITPDALTTGFYILEITGKTTLKASRIIKIE